MYRYRIAAADIGTYMPSVDQRGGYGASVLNGKNFYFTSTGPKSGFATRVLSPFPLFSPRDVQGIRIQERTLVFAQDAILGWRTNLPFAWEVLYSFKTPTTAGHRDPWQAVYMNGTIYLSQTDRGFFAAPVVPNESKLWLKQQTSSDILGLISGIRGMALVHNRVILVSDTMIQWSNTGDFSDLTPGLGGPGFTLIAQFSSGKFVALSPFDDGFIVWTTAGGILAEFIDGDSVWRFTPINSELHPLGPWATARMSNGLSVILTEQGLVSTQNGETPKALTPDLNEYLRTYIKPNVNLSQQWRLAYDEAEELLYVMESQDATLYSRAFVVSVTLNRVGLFNIPVYGILPLTQYDYGFVDALGVAQVHAPESFNREIDPANELGASRVYPRFQKQLPIPSSSAVSRALTLPEGADVVEVPQAGWYLPTAPAVPVSGWGGLDSSVEIGYLLQEDRYSPTGRSMHLASDTRLEIQQVVVGGVPVAAPLPMDFTTAWNKSGFYGTSEDWDSAPTLVSADVIEDWLTATGDEDNSALPVTRSEDWLTESDDSNTFTVDVAEDWNNAGVAEEWNGQFSGLPALSYGIVVRVSQDGITFDEVTPKMARFNAAAQVWACIADGPLQVLRLTATEVNEFFHVQYLDITQDSTGQVA